MSKVGEVLDHVYYRCGFCGGRGVPIAKNLFCWICSGTGKVKVEPFAVVCAYCRGSGKSILNWTLPCLACKGKGVVRVDGRMIRPCPDCRGQGKAKGPGLPCVECGGSGLDMSSGQEPAVEASGAG